AVCKTISTSVPYYLYEINCYKLPYSNRSTSIGFQYPQHHPQSIDRRRKEHHTEPAHRGIECIGLKRQMIGGCNFKMDISKFSICCRSKRSRNHFRSWVYTPDLTVR